MVFVFATLRRLSRLLFFAFFARVRSLSACVRSFVRSFAVEDLASAGFFLFGQPGWAWRRPMRERGDKKGGRLLATATTTLVFSCSHWVPIGFAL
jgi:hypothetical protein